MQNKKVTPGKFELNKIFLTCPSCGFIPQNSALFLSLPISNYNMGHNKLMLLKCPTDLCSFKGNILEWLRFD